MKIGSESSTEISISKKDGKFLVYLDIDGEVGNYQGVGEYIKETEYHDMINGLGRVLKEEVNEIVFDFLNSPLKMMISRFEDTYIISIAFTAQTNDGSEQIKVFHYLSYESLQNIIYTMRFELAKADNNSDAFSKIKVAEIEFCEGLDTSTDTYIVSSDDEVNDTVIVTKEDSIVVGVIKSIEIVDRFDEMYDLHSLAKITDNLTKMKDINSNFKLCDVSDDMKTLVFEDDTKQQKNIMFDMFINYKFDTIKKYHISDNVITMYLFGEDDKGKEVFLYIIMKYLGVKDLCYMCIKERMIDSGLCKINMIAMDNISKNFK